MQKWRVNIEIKGNYTKYEATIVFANTEKEAKIIASIQDGIKVEDTYPINANYRYIIQNGGAKGPCEKTACRP